MLILSYGALIITKSERGFVFSFIDLDINKYKVFIDRFDK